MAASMFGVGFLTLLAFFTGGAALPLGVPPVEDPLMLKIAPAECVAYVTWSGMGKADPASKNSTEAMMAGAEVQRILTQLDQSLTAALLAIPTDDEESPIATAAKEGVPLGRVLLSNPTAIFIESIGEGEAGPDIRGGALVNLGDNAAKVQASLERLQTQFLKDAVKKVDLGGMPGSQINLGGGVPQINWAIKGKYLFVGFGAGSVEGIVKRGSGAAPKWLTELKQGSHIERMSSLVHVDVAKLKESTLPLLGPDGERFIGILRGLGVDNIAAFDMLSGLDAKGFLSQTKLTLAGETKGILTAVSDKPLSPLDLETIPADSTFAVAVRADAAELYNTFRQVVGNVQPGAEDEVERELRQVEEQTGVRIIDGIFRGLGDVWCAYNSPGEGGLLFTGLTITVNVRDHDRLLGEYLKIHKIVSDEAERVRGFRDGRGPQVKEIEFAGEKIHFMTGERDFIVAPSFCLTKDHLIFSLFPQNIEALLSRDKTFQSLATSQHVGPHMKMDGGPSVIVYQDTRELFKMLYPLVPMMGQTMANEMGVDAGFDLSLLPSVKAIAPHLQPGLTTIARTDDAVIFESRNTLPGGIIGAGGPVVAGMYAPAIRSSWEAAGRAQAANNLKQLALALHIYHDANLHFPQAFTTDKEGKPLLSWRVAILPYIEQDALYKEFHLDEPWDSEHNKKLLARMPEVFRARTSKADPFKTVYLAPRITGGVLSGQKVGDEIEKVTIADVRDGTSNTIMLVEASDARAVEWTKPDDLVVDPKEPLAGILGQHRKGFLSALTDGSVQFISGRVDAETLRNAFDRKDGNIVDLWSYQVDNGGGRGGFGVVERRVEARPAPVETRVEEAAPEPDVTVPDELEPAVP